jgi:hypothetical protein
MTSRWPWLSKYDPAICDRCARAREWHCENCGACGPTGDCQVCAGWAGDVVVDADDWFEEDLEWPCRETVRPEEAK